MQDAATIIHTPFSAEVHLLSKFPVLILEDIEDLIESVDCDGESIEVTFLTHESLIMVEEVLTLASPFVIITSHWSCNDDGSRLPYMYGYFSTP